MFCNDVMELIEDKYSKKYALEWDNVGLLVGRDDKKVKKIYLALDATDQVIDAAVKAEVDLLITHHPLIFSGIKKINNQDFIGRRLLKLIQNDISYYAMHTNYDVMGMSALVGNKVKLETAEVLKVTGESTAGAEGIGRIAGVTEKMTLQECADLVKEAFCLQTVKVFGDLEMQIQRIAISPGSGKSMIQVALEKEADVLITGDIGHHEGIDAVAQGMAIIDAGHYGIEHVFVEDMRAYLTAACEGIEVLTEPVSHPFVVI